MGSIIPGVAMGVTSIDAHPLLIRGADDGRHVTTVGTGTINITTSQTE